MKVAFVTYAAAPYRAKQFEQFSKIAVLDVYYISKKMVDRKWTIEETEADYTETSLPVSLDTKVVGTLNKGLKAITKDHDVVFIGGYSSLSYIVLSVLCKFYKTPSVVIFDGVSPKKIKQKSNFLKDFLKNIVVNNSSAVFGNGSVSKLFFKENFNYDRPIISQILTSNIEDIQTLSLEKNYWRKTVRQKYGIAEDSIVIIYSGRLLPRKNIHDLVASINLTRNQQIHLLVLGGGTQEQETSLKEQAEKLKVPLTLTGFISNQSQLFQAYFAGDIFVLPSSDEPWGLVINEAMAAGLPIIASDECGAILDLVKDNDNGFIFETGNVTELTEKITHLIDNSLLETFGENSQEMIKDWTFVNSATHFGKVLDLFSKEK